MTHHPMVAEIKINDTTNYSMSECFRKTSGVAAAITIDALKQGRLANRVVVYGVVAKVDCLDHSQFLKLEWDFETTTRQLTKS